MVPLHGIIKRSSADYPHGHGSVLLHSGRHQGQVLPIHGSRCYDEKDMKKLSHEQRIFFRKAGVVLLAVLCVLALYWFVSAFRQIYSEGDLRPDYPLRNVPVAPMPATTVTTIDTWMTFNYLNVVFKLPPTYLQKQLKITDPRYPNIRIDGYARRNHLSPETVLHAVQQAIRNYRPTQ